VTTGQTVDLRLAPNGALWLNSCHGEEPVRLKTALFIILPNCRGFAGRAKLQQNRLKSGRERLD